MLLLLSACQLPVDRSQHIAPARLIGFNPQAIIGSIYKIANEAVWLGEVEAPAKEAAIQKAMNYAASWP